ncbi:MAG: phosphate signaling complex protein PhoU [Bacillota bacterium]|nr:phosphate signaling complex protein PhoU [Bacillota bacterium]
MIKKRMSKILLLSAAVLVLLLLTLSFAGCGNSKSSEMIQIKGSDSEVNLVQRLAEEFMAENSEVQIAVTGGGSGVGIAALIDGTTDLSNSSRPMKGEEVELAKGKGVEPVAVRFAVDGVAVILNENNNVDSLSVEEIGAIYRGEIKNWSEVGGQDEEVVRGDESIDKLELEIEEGCLALIATQQPMAKDLRKVATLFKMIVNLERMADYASSIAKIVCRIGSDPLIKPLVDIPRMAVTTQIMVKESLDAYIHENLELALEMIEKDDEVDKLHAQIFRELLTIMMENPKTITQATHLLFVSRYLERIADHATNIGKEVIFLVTGEKRYKTK